jgi:hypothetical protein
MKRRHRTPQSASLWLAVATILLAGCTAGTAAAGGAANTPAQPVGTTLGGGPATSPAAAQSPTRPPPAPKPARPSALPVAPGAGRLGQTRAFPSTTSTAFKNVIHDLWLAVTTGQPRYALPAFFPVTAYEQVKAIADPKSDWENRLWYEFTLDVAAAHDLLGAHAKLIRVIVPTEYAAWVYPGGCYNSIGYWHLPGSRVVYEQGSQVRSFGIASLISWRGVWYVVHFGAVIRSGAGGEVDDPTAGTGVPGPPGGC